MTPIQKAVLQERKGGVERVQLFRRLWDGSVTTPSGCRLWQGDTVPAGYGKISFAGTSWLVHRAMFLCTRGALPDGALICQRCGNLTCIEPSCLFAATERDKARKTLIDGRNPSAKMTPDLVRAMRRDFDSGAMNIAELCRAYGLSRKPTHYIVHRKSWQHIS